MGNSFELEGTLKIINDVQTFQSGFTKREFVVEVQDGNYPQMIKFECVKDKTSLTDSFSVDDPVRVHFDIRGNEYNDRFYVNLNAWRLEKAGGGEGAPAPSPASAGDAPEPPPGHIEESDDDIPF